MQERDVLDLFLVAVLAVLTYVEAFGLADPIATVDEVLAILTVIDVEVYLVLGGCSASSSSATSRSTSRRKTPASPSVDNRRSCAAAATVASDGPVASAWRPRDLYLGASMRQAMTDFDPERFEDKYANYFPELQKAYKQAFGR